MIRSKMNPYVDLSYDIFRRIIQFGKINETDATKLVRLVLIQGSKVSGSAQKKTIWSSVFFNPKNELIRIEKSQSNSSWSNFNPFGRGRSSAVAQDDPVPEINCSISETISFKMKNGRLLISECIGKVELTLSSMIPGLQTVLLELNTKPDATILPNLNVEMRNTESAVILEAPVTNLTKYLIANYETILKSIPISIDSKLRLRDQDKVSSSLFMTYQITPSTPKLGHLTV